MAVSTSMCRRSTRYFVSWYNTLHLEGIVHRRHATTDFSSVCDRLFPRISWFAPEQATLDLRWHSFRASSCDVETVVLRTMWAAVTFDVHMSHCRQAQECCRYLPEGLTWNSLSTYTCLSKVQHKTTSIMPRQRGRTRTSCMNGRLALANGMRALMKPKREGAWDQDLALTGEPCSHRGASVRRRSIEEVVSRAHYGAW
jgi:hypothetical protein